MNIEGVRLPPEKIQEVYKNYEFVKDILDVHMIFLQDIADAQTRHLIKLGWGSRELLEEKLRKVCKWLDMLIAQAEKQLKTERFITLREALEADIKNYKATKSDIETALKKGD